MGRPLIAIFGSVDPSRAERLALREPERARAAAEELGAELARRDCRLLVSSAVASMEFVEANVIRGYVASGAAKKESIEVHRPIGCDASFAEEATGAELFDVRLESGDDWAIGSFCSLAKADGLVLVGGGQSTWTAGLVGIGYRVPMVALAHFGGRAKDVWSLLRSNHPLATEGELVAMGQPWTDDSPRRCVDSLLAQRDRKQKESPPDPRSLRRRMAWMAVGGAAMVLAFLGAVAASAVGNELSALSAADLFCLPAVMGGAGFLVRAAFDWTRNARQSVESAVIGSALGVVAGGLSGLFFVLAQKLAIGELNGHQAIVLLPFCGVTGFLAGLTLDKVFPKLLEKDVVRLEALDGKPV